MQTIHVYDSHCHLNALTEIPSIAKVAVPAIMLNDIAKLSDYRQNHNSQAKIGIGVHPWYIETNTDLNKLADDLKSLIEQYRPDFIGETGLDKNRPHFSLQQEIFSLHLQIAKEYQLPIVIHCVRAYSELLEKLKNNPAVCGVVHAYNGNSHIARELSRYNMYLGIGSIILNSNSQLAKSAAKLPISQLLIESDAPYMPKPGQTVSSTHDCKEYANQLASYLQMIPEQLINQLNQNWELAFR